MLPAMPQRTADTLLAAPAPITDARDHVRGRQRVAEGDVALKRTAAPAPCAEKPCAGSILMIRVPIVRMMRQPPE